jgi:hypothetical protein
MCVIHSFYSERLRIDGFLTNCHTADRIFICDNPGKSLPRSARIGKYFATIIRKGQIDPRKQTLKCNKCLHKPISNTSAQTSEHVDSAINLAIEKMNARKI